MGRWSTGAIVLAGCFQATAPLGAPCAQNGACPDGQVCDHSRSPPVCVDHLQDASPPDAPAGPTLAVTGTVQVGGKPIAGANVVAFPQLDETTPLDDTTTSDQGAFALRVPSPFDGFLRVTFPGYAASYSYPADVLADDLVNLALPLVTQATLDALYQATGVGDETHAQIGLAVLDAAARPVAGVAVACEPMAIAKYNRNSIPDKTATTTDTDGIAYLLDAAPDAHVAVGAPRFKAHEVTARPGTLTLTLLVALTPP